MSRSYHHFFRLSLKRTLAQSLCLGAGLISSALLFSSAGNAETPQPVSTNEVSKYAKAVLYMEPERRQALEEIKKIIGNSEVPTIACNDTNSLSNLPGQAQDVAKNYCKTSQSAVENSGLSVNRFNEITTEQQNNQDLQRQIYNTLIRLQKNPDSQ